MRDANETTTTERLIGGAERAILVLGALADARGDLGTNEIARRTGINASSVSRLLATLAKHDYVRRIPETGRYGLGLRLVELGNAAIATVDVREAVRPHLVALVESTGETATLNVPAEHSTITVDFVQSPSSVRSVAEIGRPAIPHATAVGKVCLAYGGRLPSGPLRRYTPRTITDRPALAKEVALVRERGWARAEGEREADLNAIAVPILNPRGDLVAVLGLQGPAGRLTADVMPEAAKDVIAAASAVMTRATL